ncbi:MAG: sporulation protein YqfD, partial [Caldanaerobacter sp.]
MFSIKLWNFLRGYVIIKVEGLAIEKFLNLVMVNEVYIWDIERIGYATLTAKVSRRAFKEVIKYAKKTGCRVSIVSKNGLPFLAFRLKRRKGIIIGFVFSFLIIYIFSTFIWEIDIKTVNGLREEEVAKKLSELGLKPGVSKFKIDINKLEKEFLLNNEEVSWIGININGTRAYVKVVGKTKPQKVLSKEEPCNIIAKRDGIIYKMTVLEGEAVKKPGDTVKMGE